MKKIILLIAFIFPMVIFAADSSYVYIKKSALSTQDLQRLESGSTTMKSVENVMNTMETFQGRVDPREIGLAIDTVASTLTGQTQAFAESKVGRFTIFLIVWNVFGEGMSDLFLKTIYFILFILFFVTTWRRLFIKKKYIKQKSRVMFLGFIPRWKTAEWTTFNSPEEAYDSNNKHGSEFDPSAYWWIRLAMICFFIANVLILLCA